jgi:hypothetical protein
MLKNSIVCFLLLLMYPLSAFQKWLKFLWKVFFKKWPVFHVDCFTCPKNLI